MLASSFDFSTILLIALFLIILSSYYPLVKAYMFAKEIRGFLHDMSTFPMYILITLNINYETLRLLPLNLVEELEIKRSPFLCDNERELLESIIFLKNPLTTFFADALLSGLRKISLSRDVLVNTSREILCSSLTFRKELLDFLAEREKLVFFLVVFSPLSLLILAFLVNYMYIFTIFLCEISGSLIYLHFLQKMHRQMTQDITRRFLLEV